MKLNLSKPKEFYLKIIVFLFIILMCVLIFIKFHKDTNPSQIEEAQKNAIFSQIDKNTKVNVSKYAVYGTQFNIEGSFDILKISGIKINYVDLIIRTLDGNETTLKSSFTFSDNTCSFLTSDEINRGLNLDNLSPDTYYLLIKATYSNGDIKYYSLNNNSDCSDITYYTITKNNSNNKISISFESYKDIPYIAIKVSQIQSLPDDVYDIAIDPAHGGTDTGTIIDNTTEANLLLSVATNLKSKLEDLGLKVFISRDNNSSSKEDTTKNMYDDDGRINILNASHAKLLISLDMNNNSYNKNTGGIEVYAPSNCNLDFATLLVNNIVQKSNSYYSEYTSFKKADRSLC